MASDGSLPFSSLSPRRKRPRSPSQSPSSGSDNAQASRRQGRRHDLSVDVCKDFIRSVCRRAEIVCKFAHPPSTVTIERVVACADSLRNKCFRGRSCRYFHPPPHIQESLLRAISMEDAKDSVRHRSPSPSPSDGFDDTEASRRQRRQHDLSVEVCKDFICSACRRAEIDCKFAHPPSAVTVERGKVIVCTNSLRSKCFRGLTCPYFHPPPHIQEPLLNANGTEDTKNPMRQQSPSQSPSYDHNDAKASHRQHRRHDLSVAVCEDFISSGCRRADIDCNFAHPPSVVTVEGGKVIACIDSLRGKCFHGRTCPYFHPPPQIQESLLKEIGIEDTKDSMDLQHRRSSVKLSSYPRPGNDHEFVAACRDFLKNACNRRSCKYAHPDSRAMGPLQHHGLSLELHSSTLLESGAVPNAMPLYSDIVPVFKDFLKNACDRDHCRYFHLVPQAEVYLQQHGTLVKLPSSPPPETEQKKLSVCRDFLKNACRRDACKYAHPNSRIKVVDNQVEICRDFHRELCRRDICRFYHRR